MTYFWDALEIVAATICVILVAAMVVVAVGALRLWLDARRDERKERDAKIPAFTDEKRNAPVRVEFFREAECPCCHEKIGIVSTRPKYGSTFTPTHLQLFPVEEWPNVEKQFPLDEIDYDDDGVRPGNT